MAAITVSDLAQELGTDARTARKFLRDITPAEAHPGKGSRWSIEKREVRSLKSKFTKWESARQAARNDAPADEAPADEVDAPEDEVE